MPAFLSPAEAEFWVFVGLVIFLIIAFVFGRKAAFGTLDANAVKIRGDLDEAARLRSEAEALLKQIQAERAESERQSAEMLANARAEAERASADAKAKLDEQIIRRQQLAERKIATAEAQAAAEVKATAVELAARAAEQILSQRLAAGRPDPLLERSIAQLATRLS
jgi:F-type H+-transporting ATPase subunit b